VETAQTGFFGISSSRLSAYLAVLLLVAFVGWRAGTSTSTASPQIQVAASATDNTSNDALAALAASTVEPPEGVTELGASIVAQAVVAFDKATQQASSSDAGIAAVQSYGAELKPPIQYKIYSAGEVKTDQNTSKDRVLSYRADLRAALAPLLENKEFELDVFAKYVDTKDPKYLNDLRTASQNYKLAIANTEKVIAPADAASYHAAILTAMSEFSAMLDTLADNATDPIASSALMRNFLDAEGSMVASFNSIGKYSGEKIL
jgi:hypothetical protein